MCVYQLTEASVGAILALLYESQSVPVLYERLLIADMADAD